MANGCLQSFSDNRAIPHSQWGLCMIKVTSLCKRYGAITALRDVTFEVKNGEILGFLGPNGAGKTTTMKILTGYFAPTSGSVVINGLTYEKNHTIIKRSIGYLPENTPLYSDMSVREFLYFIARVKSVRRGERRAHVRRILNDCGLSSVSTRIIKHLSKGYRQRVGLAQALIGDPEILILDEPTIGLDPKQIIEIRSLIKSMAGRMTVIISSHILPEISMIADRVVVINDGSIVAIDTPDNLHKKLQSVSEISLVVLGDEHVVSDLIMEVPGVLAIRVQERKCGAIEYIVSTEKETDIRAALAAKIVRSTHSVSLLELKSVAMSLEDIFLKLVTKEEFEA